MFQKLTYNSLKALYFETNHPNIRAVVMAHTKVQLVLELQLAGLFLILTPTIITVICVYKIEVNVSLSTYIIPTLYYCNPVNACDTPFLSSILRGISNTCQPII